MTDKRIVFITVPNQEVAEKIALALVQERLAACANLIPGITSIYHWAGKLEKSSEWLMIVKTRVENFEDLRKRVVELHPYEVPEIVCFPIELGFNKYLQWIDASIDLPQERKKKTPAGKS